MSVRSGGGPARPGLARVVRAALVAVGLLPLLGWAAHASGTDGAVSELLGGWFALQCHRDPGRSLQLLGAPLPVCARCLGVYLGLCVGALVLRPRSRRLLRAWALGAALIMLVDVAVERLGLHASWAALRLCTGLALAYPVAVALVLAARSGRSSPTDP